MKYAYQNIYALVHIDFYYRGFSEAALEPDHHILHAAMTTKAHQSQSDGILLEYVVLDLAFDEILIDRIQL